MDFNQFFYGSAVGRSVGGRVGVHKFRGRRKNGAFNVDMKHILTRGLTAHYLLELCRIIHSGTREPWDLTVFAQCQDLRHLRELAM